MDTNDNAQNNKGPRAIEAQMRKRGNTKIGLCSK